MTNLETELFNQALGVFQEFGPKRRIPREQRLKDCFPDLSKNKISDMIEEFKNIESSAFDFAFKVNTKELTYDQAKQMFAKKHPTLDEETMSGTFYQALYFSCK